MKHLLTMQACVYVCRYVRHIHGSCSPQFWTFFLPMHTLPRHAIDTALGAAKKAFPGESMNLDVFPTTKRILQSNKIDNYVPPFWPRVMHTIRIDLSSFNLPISKRSLMFRFVDPLWGWIQAACIQHPGDMQWVPKRRFDPNFPHDYYYGGGVQFGESFAEVCQSCPRGTFPMCVALHWDGAHAHGLWSTPVCVGVGNTNSMSTTTRYCIGYLPVVEDMGGAYEGNSVDINHYIRQQCIAAVLRVLENGARTGVRCRLPAAGGGHL